MVMRALKILAWLAVVGAPLLLAIDFLRESLLVDRCFDSGGSFDYVRSLCDSGVSHPYIPYARRHIKPIMVGMALAVIAAMCLVVMRTKQRL